MYVYIITNASRCRPILVTRRLPYCHELPPIRGLLPLHHATVVDVPTVYHWPSRIPSYLAIMLDLVPHFVLFVSSQSIDISMAILDSCSYSRYLGVFLYSLFYTTFFIFLFIYFFFLSYQNEDENFIFCLYLFLVLRARRPQTPCPGPGEAKGRIRTAVRQSGIRSQRGQGALRRVFKKSC